MGKKSRIKNDKNTALISQVSSFLSSLNLHSISESLEDNPSSVSMTLEQNPIAVSEESMTAKKLYRFYLVMKPASKLKIALSALTDDKMNPTGIGRLDVDYRTFEITVHNPNVFCFLRLKATGMIRFECCYPFENKIVLLSEISKKLSAAADNDVVTVYHIAGSLELSFEFANDNADAEAFSVRIYSALPNYKRCPVIEFWCEVVVLSEHLREMLPFMIKDNETQLVYLRLRRERALLKLGDKQWQYAYNEKLDGVRGLEPGDDIAGAVWFPYPDSLRKASYLAAGFLLCPMHPPYNNSLWRFNLRELGDLAYVTITVVKDSDKEESPPK